MMTVTISTASLFGSLRRSVASAQSQLGDAQTELSSQRPADLGLTLGARVSLDHSLAERLAEFKEITQTNNVLANHLDLTQNILSALKDTAKGVLNAAVNAQDAQGNLTALSSTATNALQALASNVNTTSAGAYVFGGINSGVPPLKNYSATAANGQAVDAAFQALVTSVGGIQNITAADMQNFLSGPFANLFSTANGNFANLFSNASSTALSARISPTRTLDGASLTANDPAVINLTQAYVMLAGLKSTQLPPAARDILLSSATNTLQRAITQLGDAEASVGLTQQQVRDANQSMSIQQATLQQQVGDMEGIDSYEVSTRITRLMTQIETSYRITAQLQQLSLARFL